MARRCARSLGPPPLPRWDVPYWWHIQRGCSSACWLRCGGAARGQTRSHTASTAWQPRPFPDPDCFSSTASTALLCTFSPHPPASLCNCPYSLSLPHSAPPRGPAAPHWCHLPLPPPSLPPLPFWARHSHSLLLPLPVPACLLPPLSRMRQCRLYPPLPLPMQPVQPSRVTDMRDTQPERGGTSCGSRARPGRGGERLRHERLRPSQQGCDWPGKRNLTQFDGEGGETPMGRGGGGGGGGGGTPHEQREEQQGNTPWQHTRVRGCARTAAVSFEGRQSKRR